MENVHTTNKLPFHKPPITTYDPESPLVEELQHERLRQSRIIARQLDTIGKLKRALDLVMLERSGRRGSLTPRTLSIPDLIIPPDVDFTDIGLQTDTVSNRSRSQDADYDQVKRALGYLAEENLRLTRDRQESEQALLVEKAKAKRILTVCTRISSSPGQSGISPPALAKWVSMGLEDASFPVRERTETFDDGQYRRSARNSMVPMDHLGSTTTRSRSALSEGDSPVDGLDLDMIYGSSFDVPGFLDVHPDAVPLTPKASNKDTISELCGFYWTGDEMFFFRPAGGELRCDESDTVIRFVDSFILGRFTSGLAENLAGRIISMSPTITLEWSDDMTWTRVDLSNLVGDWWTGHTTISLSLSSDQSGRIQGQWGLRQILIWPTTETEIKGILLPGESPEMVGAVAPKYGQMGGRLVISWANGQTWEHISS